MNAPLEWTRCEDGFSFTDTLTDVIYLFIFLLLGCPPVFCGQPWITLSQRCEDEEGDCKTVRMSSIQRYLSLSLFRAHPYVSLSLFLSSYQTCVTIINGAISHLNITFKCLSVFLLFSCSLCSLPFQDLSSSLLTFLYVNLIVWVSCLFSRFCVFWNQGQLKKKKVFLNHTHHHESRASSSLWRWIIDTWLFILSECCKSQQSSESYHIDYGCAPGPLNV